MEDTLLLEAICNALPGGWQADLSQATQGYNRVAFFTRNDGLKLAVNSKDGSTWTIRLSLGNLWQFKPYSSTIPTMNVSKLKGGDRIAREIQSRILPDCEELYREVIAGQDRQAQRIDREARVAQKFVELGFEAPGISDGRPSIRVYEPDEGERHVLFGHFAISGYDHEVQVACQLTNLTQDQALQIAAIVKGLEPELEPFKPAIDDDGYVYFLDTLPGVRWFLHYSGWEAFHGEETEPFFRISDNVFPTDDDFAAAAAIYEERYGKVSDVGK